MKVSILSYPNESIIVILNDQNVSMTNGSKNMAYFKKKCSHGSVCPD